MFSAGNKIYYWLKGSVWLDVLFLILFPPVSSLLSHGGLPVSLRHFPRVSGWRHQSPISLYGWLHLSRSLLTGDSPEKCVLTDGPVICSLHGLCLSSFPFSWLQSFSVTTVWNCALPHLFTYFSPLECKFHTGRRFD